jgi:hypothetical protein
VTARVDRKAAWEAVIEQGSENIKGENGEELRISDRGKKEVGNEKRKIGKETPKKLICR